MVTLRGLVRRYPGAEVLALRGLNLEVATGERLVLVGPSGCGKSTALRLIAGLDTPDRGTIEIDGRDVAHIPPQDRDVAMVFQGYALYPHLTVRNNMMFPLTMRKVKVAERVRAVDNVAKLLAIGHLLDRFPGALSGGERQRVAMGRAIVRSPKVFLFDEPLSNLDAGLRSELRVEIAALLRRLGATAIYVTHDQVEAMTMGDRIAVLRGGELQQVGPPREIYEDPSNAFVAGFLGSSPINWVSADFAGDAFRGAGTVFPSPAGIGAQSRVRVGIRPEHLHLGVDGADGSNIEIEGTVTATEPLGAETQVLLDAGGTTLRTKVVGFDAPLRGTTVRLWTRASDVLWFDFATGKRLRVSGSPT